MVKRKREIEVKQGREKGKDISGREKGRLRKEEREKS
jgi:hypothetical protein